MRRRHQHVMRLMYAALLAAPLTLGACGGRYGVVEDRFYDPYYGDYHRWNRAELGLYRRWEIDTRRPHVDFARRPVGDQRAYLTWRHGR